MKMISLISLVLLFISKIRFPPGTPFNQVNLHVIISARLSYCQKEYYAVIFTSVKNIVVFSKY